MAHLDVSEAVKGRLDELVAALERTLGDSLVGVLVHGSAARGEWREGRSDVDVVVVCRDDASEKLRAIANALQVARYAARIETMILLDVEIERAADAFPLFYDDIKRCHVMLSGRDPFAALEVPRNHLRVRIEQELREAQIRMRRVVTDFGSDPTSLAGALRRKIRQVRSPLRALLALGGTECGDAVSDVYGRAGALFGVDTAPLSRVGDDPEVALRAFRELLARASEDADRREEH